MAREASHTRSRSRVILPKCGDEAIVSQLGLDKKQISLAQESDPRPSSAGKHDSHAVPIQYHHSDLEYYHSQLHQSLGTGLDTKALVNAFKPKPRREITHVSSSVQDRKVAQESTRHDAGEFVAHQPMRTASYQKKDENGEEISSKRKRNLTAKSGVSDSRLLACPFNKYDNYLFGADSPDPAYHQCGTCSFKKVAHLKQHLQRVHSLAFYCESCLRHFNAQKTLDTHTCIRPIHEVTNLPVCAEQINHYLAQELRLGRKNDKGVDRVKYWFTVFDTLFPEVSKSRPINPFFEGPGREHLKRFLAFSTPLISSLIEDIVLSIANFGLVDPSQASLSVKVFLQQAAESFHHEISETPWPRLGQQNENHKVFSRNSDSTSDQRRTITHDPPFAAPLSVLTSPYRTSTAMASGPKLTRDDAMTPSMDPSWQVQDQQTSEPLVNFDHTAGIETSPTSPTLDLPEPYEPTLSDYSVNDNTFEFLNPDIYQLSPSQKDDDGDGL